MHLLVGRYLEAGPTGLRWRAAQLIGTCSQNVAAIQEQVLGLGALRKLLRLLDRDPCDSVRVKALFAISCECPGGCREGACIPKSQSRHKVGLQESAWGQREKGLICSFIPSTYGDCVLGPGNRAVSWPAPCSSGPEPNATGTCRSLSALCPSGCSASALLTFLIVGGPSCAM